MKRSEATKAGLMFYDNGKSCPLNHSPSVRYTITGKCLECTKTEGIRYKEQRAAYYQDNSRTIIDRITAWKAANPDKVKEFAGKYREKHNLELRRKNVEYRQSNPTDPKTRVIREARRRTRKLECGGSFTKTDIEKLLHSQMGKCVYCKISIATKYSVDHIIPLALKGTSNPSNLQLLCRPCNSSKGGRDPIVFARKRGFLL